MMEGGLNTTVGSVLGSLSCVMQHRGFNPSLRRLFPVEGIFLLELTWVLTPVPKNSFGWEHQPRSSLSIHAFNRTDSKDPGIHVLVRWMPATKTPSMQYPQRRNVTTSMVGFKKSQMQKSHQNGEPQRYSWGALMKKEKNDGRGIPLNTKSYRKILTKAALVYKPKGSGDGGGGGGGGCRRGSGAWGRKKLWHVLAVVPNLWYLFLELSDLSWHTSFPYFDQSINPELNAHKTISR